MNDASPWFGIAAVITALATLVETIRRQPPRTPRRRRRAADPPPPGPTPEPPPATSTARIGIRALLTLVFAGASALTGPPVSALAPPVPFHHATLAGTVACDVAGDQLVTWAIGNSQANEPMTIVAATAALNGAPWPVVGYVSPVAPSGATEATTTLSGTLTGSLVITVRGRWPDAHHSVRSAGVELLGGCSTSTTSTTAPASTTTTSPAPSTTIAPQLGTTSTTAVAAVVAPPSSAASSIAHAPQLAATGGPVLDAAIAGLSVTLLGAVFLMAYRTDRRLGATRRRRGRNARR